ncbi:hypothetical protein R6242_21370 [Iodobacter sp. CM08]|uniref:hypothetical protein n=1 Tax=Iodobacter sp. CM08 TaxID=3085902 RepID=UPI002982691A|nr:hypothetical protein [Iodobacter sp. CM08]MDW5419127.1 hypothetical protein [Iodobacter sp. CM08]
MSLKISVGCLPLILAGLLIGSPAHAVGCGTVAIDWSSALDGTLCALKLATKQVGASTDKLIEETAAMYEIKANANKELRLAVRTVGVAQKYFPIDANGNAMGQSPFMCSVNTIERSLDNAEKEAKTGTNEWSTNVYKTSSVTGEQATFTILGRNVLTRLNAKTSAALQIRTLHDQRFCTQNEALAGVCTLQPNGLQGADTDASVLMATETYSFDQQIAATAFISRLAPVKPLPNRDLKAITCDTASCRGAIYAHRQAELMRGAARYSLMRAVEARTTGQRTGPMGSYNNK